ncbi:MAG: hypothetical protein DRP93_06270 [Candidatus Neomarinimicrobiota bacterium]|nr:MAG: hypothetical protein DRP93_06270 [Candidatus Neomarinimicrobiota bacterium]
MVHNVKIDSRRNPMFYSEAMRAGSIKEINESRGMEMLLNMEKEILIEMIKEEAVSRYEFNVIEDYDGFVLQAREIRVR